MVVKRAVKVCRVFGAFDSYVLATLTEIATELFPAPMFSPLSVVESITLGTSLASGVLQAARPELGIGLM